MPTRERDEYKRSLFDKHGPEAAHVNQIRTSLIIPVVAGAFIGAALALKTDLSPLLIALSTLAGAILLGAWWWFFITRVSRGAGALFGEFIQPNGSRTPYHRQYSEQDAMVMRGEVAQALASYEEIILASPNDPVPRIRAAELYMRNGQRDRAENLYKTVQRMPGVAVTDDVYVSNRLVDLYLQWPEREVRALTELRRLIDTYPDTDTAERARTGLANLKSRLGSAE
jgi:tetratricopeptide (TPR) repeat protein